MERSTNKDVSAAEPMKIPAGSMGLGRYFASFSQNILERYAIWEKYPWSDAVIRYLENQEREEASQVVEHSSFFVTLQLLKIYLAGQRDKGKRDREEQEVRRRELVLRIEAQLNRLKAAQDRYFGILERLYKEGAQMSGEELPEILARLEKEAGVREEQYANRWDKSRQYENRWDKSRQYENRWDKNRRHENRWDKSRQYENQWDKSRQYENQWAETSGGQAELGFAAKASAVGGSRGITPYALSGPAVRLRRMAEGHAHISGGRELFQNSVVRQQREFFTKLVRDYVVRETVRQAERYLGRELRPYEHQALKDYGDCLGRDALAFYVRENNVRLYQKMAAQVLGQLADPAQEMETLLSELPPWVSAEAARTLYLSEHQSLGENLVYPMDGRESDSMEKGKKEPGEGTENIPLSKLWEQSSHEERRRLLHHIPQAVRQAAFLWEEAGGGDGDPIQSEILKKIVERLERAQKLEVAQVPGTSQRTEPEQRAGTRQGVEVAQVPGTSQRTEPGQSAGTRQGNETAQETDLPEGWKAAKILEMDEKVETASGLSDQKISEEMGHILSELPIWISQRAVLELYPDLSRNHEEDLAYRMESLVHRVESRDDVLNSLSDMSLSGLWGQSSQEERTRLLHRIPQAVRQAAFLWEEAGGGDGDPIQSEILKKIVERLERAQKLEVAQVPGTSQGTEPGQRAGTRQGVEVAQVPGTSQGTEPGQSVGTRQGVEVAQVPGTSQGTEPGQSAGTRQGNETAQETDLPEGWKAAKILEMDEKVEAASGLSDQKISEKMGHILSELPIWISQRAVLELYPDLSRNHEEDLAHRMESLVHRVESRDNVLNSLSDMSLSGLWGQSSQEERTRLLHRIPQAVRQAAALWKETGHGDVDPHQSEILKKIVERLERAQKLEVAQVPGTSQGTEPGQSAGTRQGNETAQETDLPEGWEAAKILEMDEKVEAASGLSDQKISEEMGHILSELPIWISQRAVLELYPDLSRNHEEDLAYRMESLVHRVESRDNVLNSLGDMSLSGLWRQSSQEERTRLLYRIPQAVRQAASLWEKNGQRNQNPFHAEILKKVIERIEAVQNIETIRRIEAIQKVSDQKISDGVGYLFSERPVSVSETALREFREPVPAAGGRAGENKKQLLQAALIWLEPRIGQSLPIKEIRKNAGEIFHRAGMEMLTDRSGPQFQYMAPGGNDIIYAANALNSHSAPQNNENTQAIQELESRISRQEYIIRQEQIEREELQKRMKKQEGRENAVSKPEDMKIISGQGGGLSQKTLSRLKEQLRLERIRYGAD